MWGRRVNPTGVTFEGWAVLLSASAHLRLECVFIWCTSYASLATHAAASQTWFLGPVPPPQL